MAPQIILVLKLVREKGHENPLMAADVHIPWMWPRDQFATATWPTVPIMMPTHCVRKTAPEEIWAGEMNGSWIGLRGG